MSIVLLLAGAFLGVCLLAYLLQARLIFFPERELVCDPGEAGLPFREVEFDAMDGVRLHGWWIPAGDGRMTVLFCHGNAGNISHRLESIRVFHELGMNVLIFDYRGYGRSAGRVSEAGTYADAGAAWRWLTEEEGIDPGEIVLFGRSLGGAVAVELASRTRPRALIVEATFTTLPELGARVYPWLPVRLLARFRYDSASRIGAIRCPKLFIHSRDDEIVPLDLGRRLYERAAEPKRFLKLRGDHNAGFLVSHPRYVQGLRDFLDSLPVERSPGE